MRKQWKGLLAVGLAAAMMVTSLPALQLTKVNAAGADPINVSGSTTATVKVPDAPLNFTDLSAEEITKACGLGWNLGNTLDAWSWISGTKNDYATGEGLWGNVTTTKAIIKAVHDMGFSTIRIPVTWGANITKDYEVDEDWMSRVQEIVDYAISQDMYVMLNMHHDGCRNDAPTPHGWFDVVGTDDEFAAVREKYDGLWKTIANRFKNYDEHLMFAAMNEVFDDTNSLGWVPEGNATEAQMELLKVEMDRINTIDQDFVDIVRKSGGNNEGRWLVVQPHNTQIAAVTKDEYKDIFKMPDDPAQRVMLEIHDYDSFNSAAQMKEDVAGSYAANFRKLKEMFVDKNIPVVVGEFGFTGTNGRRFGFEGIGHMLKKYSLIGCVWDEGYQKGYAIFNRSELKPYDDCAAALLRGYYNVTDSSQIVKNSEIIPMTDLNVSSDNVTVEAGKSVTVTATAAAPADTNDTIRWITEDDTVATVSNGVIVGKAPGTTTVTAKALNGEAAKNIQVTVTAATYDNPTTDVVSDSGAVIMKSGQEVYLNATTLPENNGADIIYRSADESVVNVSCDGRVLAKSTGETTVTAISTDGKSKVIKVSVVEPAAPSEYQMRLAIHVLYNFKETADDGTELHSYYGTEFSSDIITVNGDGTYTLKFDCATDLSKDAINNGVKSLNGIGSLYIKDYDVTKGNQKKSPEGDGKLSYTSIKVDGNELLSTPTAEQSAMKGGVFDTGNPLNVWDGSVVPEDKLDIKKSLNMINFKGMDSPQVIEITFKMDGFHAQPTEKPAETPSAVPSATAPVSAAPATSPAITAQPEVKKGDVVQAASGKYQVTNTSKKTVAYKAPVKKSATVSVPNKVTINGVSYKVTSIAKNAFKGNKKLKKVTIGSGVTSIGANAFSGCKSLKTIVIKSTKLKTVGKNAFKGINKKAVIKVPAKKLKAYKKLFKSSTGFKKSMKIKK